MSAQLLYSLKAASRRSKRIWLEGLAEYSLEVPPYSTPDNELTTPEALTLTLSESCQEVIFHFVHITPVCRGASEVHSRNFSGTEKSHDIRSRTLARLLESRAATCEVYLRAVNAAASSGDCEASHIFTYRRSTQNLSCFFSETDKHLLEWPTVFEPKARSSRNSSFCR
mgnify:CR=1 FL=1